MLTDPVSFSLSLFASFYSDLQTFAQEYFAGAPVSRPVFLPSHAYELIRPLQLFLLSLQTLDCSFFSFFFSSQPKVLLEGLHVSVLIIQAFAAPNFQADPYPPCSLSLSSLSLPLPISGCSLLPPPTSRRLIVSERFGESFLLPTHPRTIRR